MAYPVRGLVAAKAITYRGLALRSAGTVETTALRERSARPPRRLPATPMATTREDLA